MQIEIEMISGEYVVTADAINLIVRFKIADVDIMTKFIQSLVLNVKSF